MRVALVLVAALLAGCFGGPNGEAPPPPAEGPSLARLNLAAEPFLDGFASPVDAAWLPDGSGHLAVVEQGGKVVLVANGTRAAAPFLDLAGRVKSGGERGLLGLAFPADYGASGRFYVYYTREPDGAVVIARHRADEGPGGGEALLVIEQPYANHNGGALAFGPDGYLYAGVGDGGAAGDPHGHGQRRDTHLGTILRLDVANASGYAVPATNPYAAGGGAPEVWAYGLRNPWRLSFDRGTGDLYVGDVGQNAREEIDFVRAGAPGGVNFGWNVWEGTHRFRVGSTEGEATFPVAEYAHEGGRCSVTGGVVYRGASHPALRGVYLFADYCTGEVWGLVGRGDAWESRVLGKLDGRPVAFAQDPAGEVVVVDHGGRLLRLGLR